MTKVAELKKRWMNDPEFRREYEKADAEFAMIEALMPLDTKPWDVVDHLDSEEAIAAYMEAVLEDGDPALIAAALMDVERARGMKNEERE